MEDLLYRYNKSMKINYKFLEFNNDVLNNIKNKKYLYHGTTIAELLTDNKEIVEMKDIALYIAEKIAKYFITFYSDPKVIKYSNSAEGKGFATAIQIFSKKINNYAYGDFYLTNDFDKAILYSKKSEKFGELGRLTSALIKGKDYFLALIDDDQLNNAIMTFKSSVGDYQKIGTERVLLLFENISNAELNYESGKKLEGGANPYNTKMPESYRLIGNLYNKKVSVLRETEFLKIKTALQGDRNNE